ncbi:MAG: peptidase S10 [Chloroflexota bacterium]
MAEKDEKEEKSETKKPQIEFKDESVQTEHTIVLNGEEVSYTATTGIIILHEEDRKKGSEPKGKLFYIAYTLNGVEEATGRPLTFSFNGGPGSASLWLHLGLLGPRRVPINDDNSQAIRPPYSVVDNEFSLLSHTDLVFIDPIGTGYSRAVEGEEDDRYWNYSKDIESVGEFIRLYTTRNKRWSSPKFLIGESYGTTRAAGVAGYLQDSHGFFLNGLMMVSVILNFQTARFEPGNDLPYPLFLPTYAVTAWYHHKLSKPFLDMSLPDFVAEVTSFAETDYTLALMQGSKLPASERSYVAQKLAGYTGLSVEYVERTNLRINIFRFTKELMRDEGKTVGRLDSRLTGYDRDEAGETFEYDPGMPGMTGVYASCFNQYVREELGFETDLPYEIISYKVFPNWKYDKSMNKYVNTAEILRQAMTKNPHLKLFVANGYYDLATPFFATDYTLTHLSLKSHLEENITTHYYEAGHMMYIHPPSLAKLRNDLVAFLRVSA